jgi:hypothetical protein
MTEFEAVGVLEKASHPPSEKSPARGTIPAQTVSGKRKDEVLGDFSATRKLTDYFSVAVGNRKKSGVDSPRFVIVRTVTSFETRKIDRRAFLFAGFAAAMGATSGATPQTPRLETLTQWLNASRKTRELALQQCLDRIREMDASIHAWV